MTQARALEILKTGANAFLTGEPGSGKTHTVNQFTEWLRQEGKSFAVTASTGIAATHINGITIHSFAGLGLKETLSETDLDVIETKEYVVKRVCSIDALIIDEISMLPASVVDSVDRVMRRIRKIDSPFGGIQIVFVGDFFQIPPISKPGHDAEFAFSAQSWKDADPLVCYLTEQHRQSDAEFLAILSGMRNGTITVSQKKRLLQCRIDPEPATRLYTHNIDVDRVNEEELSKIEGREKIYEMTSSGIPFLVSILKKQCISPEKLVVRIGASVMFTRNDFDAGYVNGTLGTIVGYTVGDLPVVRIANGDEIVAKSKEWTIEDKARIVQIPLRLAWAITVHKSQGMSLDSAAIDLSRAFEYGQGYVAISRVRSLSGLHLDGMNERAFSMHPDVIERDAWFRHLSEKLEHHD